MRLWSIHPKYLDQLGLVALWRETLLAQNVLLNKTKGYKNHPQLIRFKNHNSPIFAVGFYLNEIWKEAESRGYNFNKEKIYQNCNEISKIAVTEGQIKFEFQHLYSKLKNRDLKQFKKIMNIEHDSLEVFNLFKIVDGSIETWEVIH